MSDMPQELIEALNNTNGIVVKHVMELEQQLAELREALLIGGRECAEIEFGADHEQIKRLAHGTWAGWLEKARLELLQESSDE